MNDFVTLTCPSCGGKLQITKDIERFACGHCGNEHVVKRSGGVVSLLPVVEVLQEVQLGVDKTASELAIRRLSEEIDQLRLQRWTIEKTSNGRVYEGVFLGLALGFPPMAIVIALSASAGAVSSLFLGLVVAAIVCIPCFKWGYNRQQKENSTQFELIDHEIDIREKEIRKHRLMVRA